MGQLGTPASFLDEGRHSPIAGTGDLRRWRSLISQIRRAAEHERTPASIADAGVVSLITGRHRRAIEQLEWALALEPSILAANDLAAAYLAGAELEGEVMDLLHALEAASRAAERAPSRPEPAFNLALAWTRLHLRRNAMDAWERFLALESAGSWAEEARRNLVRLRQEADIGSWKEMRQRLLAEDPLAGALVGRTVAEYPYRVRVMCRQELLPAWAEAIVEHDLETAGEWLDRAAMVAEVLSGSRDERLLLDEVDGIRGLRSPTRDPSPESLRRARALLRFTQGMRRYDAQDFASAAAILESSIETLGRQRSPLLLVARLYLAICHHYGDLSGAAAMLEELLAITPGAYPTVRGRALWMLGTIAGGQRRFEDAIRHYRDAHGLIEKGAGPARAAILNLLLAEIFDLRGEVVRGWKERAEALDLVGRKGSPRRRYGVAFEAAQALSRHGRPELALLFLQEASAHLEDHRVAPAGAEVHLEAARIHNRLRQDEASREALKTARGYIARVEESALKERLRGTADLLEAQRLVESDPAGAVRRLQQAYDAHRASGYRFEELVYLSDLARAQRLAGDLDGTRQTLEAAVESYEGSRREAAEVVSRIDAFRTARPIFDQIISLHLEAAPPAWQEAFRWAERSRAQTILDLWPTPEPEESLPPLATAEAVRRRLPPDTVVLEYASVGGRLGCWILDRQGVRFQQLTVRAQDLAARAGAYSSALRAGASADVLRRRGGDLYRTLLTPLDLDLARGARLVVIPDGPIRGIPFAALVDPASGTYLVETAAVAYAPSATLFLLAEERRTWTADGIAPLVVGVPDLAGGPYNYLPDLPAAREEAESIASDLAGSRLLLAGDATRRRVMELLPGAGAFHFSGHALSSAEDWNASALVLSPAAERNDGLLRVADLFGSPLTDLQLVTLSACETLAGYEGGREGTMGLALAFFASGVPSVAGTLWQVDDRASSELMRSFYRELEEAGTAAEALRSATVDWLSRAEADQRSPVFWAAFAVIGV